MKIIDRLLDRCNNRCEICNKPLSSRTPAVVKLYDKGLGIRQTDDNCIVSCEGMANEMSSLTINEKFLRVINNQVPISCPYKLAIKKIATKKKANKVTKGTRSRTASEHPVYSYFLKKNPRAPVESRSQNPPAILNTDLPKIHSTYVWPTVAPIEKRINNWKLDLSVGRMKLQTIIRLLDQAKALGLSDDFVKDLINAKNSKKYLSETTYSIGKDGVISIK